MAVAAAEHAVAAGCLENCLALAVDLLQVHIDHALRLPADQVEAATLQVVVQHEPVALARLVLQADPAGTLEHAFVHLAVAVAALAHAATLAAVEAVAARVVQPAAAEAEAPATPVVVAAVDVASVLADLAGPVVQADLQVEATAAPAAHLAAANSTDSLTVCGSGVEDVAVNEQVVKHVDP
ncbi:MAG: hypothetical protein AB8G99_22345 [Planctomycetaceae bacterium]